MIRAFVRFTNTLQSRLIAATTLPLLALTIVLTTVTMVDRNREITRRLHEGGESIATYLASVSDFALYSADKELLNSLVSATTRLDNVSGITFLNLNNEVVVSTLKTNGGHPNIPLASMRADQSGVRSLSITPGGAIYFYAPVLAAGIDTEDYNTADNDLEPQLVGWVVAELDPTASYIERRTMLLSAIGVSVGIMIMAVALSYLLSRNIISPIRKLTNTVNSIEGGDLSIRAPATPSYEFNVLAQGINHMVASIEENQIQLQREVNSATSQLQATLSDLQSKNGELEVTMQLADEANAAKTDFLARMSHELRTPLTSIQGFIKLLEDAGLGKPEQQYCEIIDQAAQLLLQLIDDILEFTRLQASATGLEELPIDFYQCLDDPIQLLAPMAYDKDLELILDVDPDIPLALIADSRRIRQIISNLVSNSIKFTSTGYVLVQVSLVANEAANCRVVIAVTDTGIGISDDQKEHIFEAFTQADISISRRFGGTGLGLPIVKGLIDLMGGSISVDSVEGQGSAIKVTLPLKKQQVLLAEGSGGTAPREKLAMHLAIYDPNEISWRALEHLLMRIVDKYTRYTVIDELRAGLDSNEFSVLLVNDISAPLVDPQVVSSQLPPSLLADIRQSTNLPLIITLPLKQIQQHLASEQGDSLQPASFVGKPLSLANLYNILAGTVETPGADRTAEKSLEGVNALVAEDNEFSQLLIKTLLERAGCRYYLANNGYEAVQISTRKQFDIMLIDGHMPGLDGSETLREIRTLTNPNHITPAIFLTADVLTQRDGFSADIGVNQVMHKPFEESALIDAMRKLVGKKGPTEQEPPSIWQRVPKEKFFPAVEALLDKARLANRHQDVAELSEAIHQLLGIAGVFKFGALSELAGVLHRTAKAGDPSQVDVALVALTMELGKLKQETA